MKILLTGGCGFIGSHTAVALVKEGYDIVIGDNYVNSKPEALRRIMTLCEKEIPFYDLDFCEKEAVRSLFEKEHPDAVIHFAGLKAVGESVSQPLRYYRNNLDSTLTLLEVMEEYGVKNLIFSSSATVYGTPKSFPITEDMPIGGCTNPYGQTKFMIEHILRDACVADPALSVVLLRYFNPIGAHESGLLLEDPNGIPNNLMPYVLQVAAKKRPHLNVFGSDYDTPDGTGVRDYIHVCDLADGHVKAVAYAKDHTGAEAINLGTGNGYSVLDVVKTFEDVNGVPVPYVIAPRREGDVAPNYACPDTARHLLGWSAKRDLSDMCRDAWKAQSLNPDGYPEV